MYRTMRRVCLVALLGALLLAANLPAGSLAAAVPGPSNGTKQPGCRAGQGPSGAPNAITGRGRHLVLQVRGAG